MFGSGKLRDCHASLMVASGVDIAVVSKLLGHVLIAITADVYGHLIGTVGSDAVNRAANLIARTVQHMRVWMPDEQPKGV
jgi:site-specific recombinase XerD